MMLPASMMSVTPSGDINVDLTVLGFITLCYCSWIYGKTRSTIILFVLYFVSNLVPFHFESKVLRHIAPDSRYSINHRRIRCPEQETA